MFATFFFKQYRPGKCLIWYCKKKEKKKKKKRFLSYKNKKFKKLKNRHFFKGVNPWFWSKNGHYSNFFFLRNIDDENVFYVILKRENGFLGYKNKKFKKLKNWHFFIRVNPRFWSKKGYFCNFFFKQYRPGKCLIWYCKKKEKKEKKKRLSRL